MIHSKDLETKILATLLNHPKSFALIDGLINEGDFYTGNESFVHKTIFKIIKMAHNAGDGDSLDPTIVIEKLNNLKISFPDNLQASDYIEHLHLKKTTPDTLISLAKQLKSYSAVRYYQNLSDQLKLKASSLSTEDVPKIVEQMDSLFNSKVDFYCEENTKPENIYDDIEEWLEELAENPRDPGMFLPHMDYCNKMYGSLFLPGNITVICARTGDGKTTLALDWVSKVSAAYDNVPILHFDNGEMSKRELQERQVAALSGVPLFLIKKGLWKNSSYTDPETGDYIPKEETRNKVYQALTTMKERKFMYFNVAGYSVDEMIQVARRFWLNHVGRGNPMILSFDYIKLGNESSQGKATWDVLGDVMEKFKNFIQRDTVHNGNPSISMITSVQANRLGIVGNRGGDSVVQDLSVVAGSDKISGISTHLFYLRRRTNDEQQTEPFSYRQATHRLICLKHRHLGEDHLRATQEVPIPALDDDGEVVGNERLESNCLLLRVDNFGVSEVGDLRDMAAQMRTQGVEPDEDGEIA